MLAQEAHNVFRGRTRQKDFRHALLLEAGYVFLRNDASDEHKAIIHAALAQELNYARAESVVRAAQYGDSHSINVFLKRGSGYHLRRLPETGVDNFHACVAKRARDNLRATVVTVES